MPETRSKDPKTRAGTNRQQASVPTARKRARSSLDGQSKKKARNVSDNDEPEEPKEPKSQDKRKKGKKNR
jgi:hypothetical protein